MSKKNNFIFLITLLISSIAFANGEIDQGKSSDDTIFDMSVYMKACGGVAYPQCDSKDQNQLTIYQHAERVAKMTNRGIFLIAGADWCPPCRMFAKTLNENPEIAKQIEEKFLIVNLSADTSTTKSSKQLLEYLKIGVYGFPTFFVVDPVKNTSEKLILRSYTDLRYVKDLLFNSSTKDRLELAVREIKTLSNIPIKALETPIDLNEKFGQYPYFKSGGFITSKETEADKYLNAGLARLHNFHYTDAVRAFSQALKLEPNNDLARSFLALSYAFLDSRNGIQFANYELSKVSSNSLSGITLAWYEFIKAYIANSYNGSSEGKVVSLDQALEKLYDRLGEDDLEALTLGQYLAQKTKEHNTFYKALSIMPEHVGANHYLIHLHEEGRNYVRALEHAEKMAAVATDSPHAQHMLGHVLPRFKEWGRAKQQFELSAEIHVNWAKKNNYELYYDWHYAHNLDLLAITYLAFGEQDKALVTFATACPYDKRACESLLKLGAAESRLSVVTWVDAYYKQMGVKESARIKYLYPYIVEAGFSEFINNKFSEKSLETYEAFLETLTRADISGLEGSDLIAALMIISYEANKNITDDKKAEFENSMKDLIGKISLFAQNKVGCSSFDGWGKGLLDSYRLYKLSKLMGEEDLAKPLKSILKDSLGIPMSLD